MKTAISETRYKDISAIRMESDAIVLTIIPESGAKVQSIFDRKAQKEILFQSKRERFRWAAYGDGFPLGDMSGFDEVFPTIDECFYPTGPWSGTHIPDHGEVWALHWGCEVEKDSLMLSVHGVKCPYRIEKRVEFLRDDCFRMTYRVENFSDFDLPSIWCPHPFFTAGEHSHVVLPPSVRRVISTCPLENKLGAYGSIHTWPVTPLADGMPYDISDVLNPPYVGKCEKVYALDPVDEGWCAFQNTETGHTVGLSYPIDRLPYLGVWEGTVESRYVTALEPVTGALDRLDLAVLAGKAGVIRAKSTEEWYLNITLGVAGKIKSITGDGLIISD